MNENAARLDWAGAGVRVPRRFVTPRVLRLAVERALGGAGDSRSRTGAGGVGAGARCGAAAVAALEGLAADRSVDADGVEITAC